MRLSSIHSYPLKSAGGQSHQQIEVRARGLRGDRRWMLIDDQQRFVTGRLLPQLVLLQAQALADGGLQLGWTDGTQCVVTVPSAQDQRLRVRVWADEVEAPLAADSSNDWLSERLGKRVRLVYMDAVAQRMTSGKHGVAAQPVSFADGYPLLLCNDSSRSALAQMVGKPLAMGRFRPNLVVSGAPAWAEDDWRVLDIGGIRFRVVSPCARCVFTTVDPASGERDGDGEPLATLRRHRQHGDGVIFGVNLLPIGAADAATGSFGMVRDGAQVDVLE